MDGVIDDDSESFGGIVRVVVRGTYKCEWISALFAAPPLFYCAKNDVLEQCWPGRNVRERDDTFKKRDVVSWKIRYRILCILLFYEVSSWLSHQGGSFLLYLTVYQRKRRNEWILRRKTHRCVLENKTSILHFLSKVLLRIEEHLRQLLIDIGLNLLFASILLSFLG